MKLFEELKSKKQNIVSTAQNNNNLIEINQNEDSEEEMGEKIKQNTMDTESDEKGVKININLNGDTS